MLDKTFLDKFISMSARIEFMIQHLFHKHMFT
jgi:hypothetical protein